MSTREIQSSLGKLDISGSNKPTPRPKKAEPAESWEDEADEQSSSTETENEPLATEGNTPPAPPPPTPSSPSFAKPSDQPLLHYSDEAFDRYDVRNRAAKEDTELKRPEKSVAVASRLIAAGIGQKAPRRTKEQREYDQAMKIQEKKKRDQAKAEEAQKKAEVEKAKRDIWGD